MGSAGPWNEASALEKITPFSAEPGGLLPALRALQSCFGLIDERAIVLLADIFNLSKSEVHGVVSFYHDFHDEPAGVHTVKVCQAEACQAMGSRRLTEQVKQQLGVDFFETTSDGQFTLEPVYCLGNCACSPAIMVDEVTYGRIDAERLAQVLDDHRAPADA
jgi:formate dehydrogenase subunit gamma